MLSVAVDITAYARNRFGGISRVCYHTAEQLSKGNSLSVTGYFSHGDRPEIPRIAIRHHRPWSRIIGERYDISHSLCHRRLELKARHHLYTVHDAWSFEPNRYQSPVFQKKLGERMRREVARADLILTDSQWSRTQLLQFGLIDDSKCQVLPIGVSLPEASDYSPSPPAGLPRKEMPYVLFVGRLENRKNIPHILDAISPLRDLHLVLLGEPGFGYEEELVPKLSAFPADRLTILARIAEPQLLWLYRNALATVQPSWDEGFGLPILEAMAAGSAVVTSNCAAMTEVAGDAAILVDPRAPEETRRSLERLRDDPPYRTGLIAAGRKQAEAFTWGNYGERLVRIYEALAGGA